MIIRGRKWGWGERTRNERQRRIWKWERAERDRVHYQAGLSGPASKWAAKDIVGKKHAAVGLFYLIWTSSKIDPHLHLRLIRAHLNKTYNITTRLKRTIYVPSPVSCSSLFTTSTHILFVSSHIQSTCLIFVLSLSFLICAHLTLLLVLSISQFRCVLHYPVYVWINDNIRREHIFKLIVYENITVSSMIKLSLTLKLRMLKVYDTCQELVTCG